MNKAADQALIPSHSKTQVNRSVGRAVLFGLVLLVSSGLKSNPYVQAVAVSILGFFALSLAVIVFAGRLDLGKFKQVAAGTNRVPVDVDGIGVA